MPGSAESLFRPRTVAIVGASESGGGGWSRGVYENLAHENFPARVYLVNPRRDALWGRRVYPDFASLPERVDLAVVVVPAEAVPGVLAEGAAAGLRCALVYAARFGEGGDEAGARRARRLRKLCEDTGLTVAGPNCMGALSLPERLLLYPTPRVRGLAPGPVGVIFQSGGTFQFWLEQGAVRGLGYSYAVSSGNELGLDAADYLDFLVDDPGTRVVACMLEGVRRADALTAAARRALDAGKPVIVLKLGRSAAGRAAALSHTGALAGDDRVFDAFCRRHGIARVDTLDEMVEAALAFCGGRLPAGPRVAMVGYSGGARGLFGDYADGLGLELPEFSPETRAGLAELVDAGMPASNPLDAGAGLARRHGTFSRVCRIVAADPNVDMVSVQGQLPLAEGTEGDPRHFREILDSTDKPVVAHGRMSQNVGDAGRAFQRAAGIPFLQRLPEAAKTLRALWRHAEARGRGAAPFVPRPGPAAGPDEVARRLAGRGLREPRSALAPSADAVGEAAAEVGFRVAVMSVSPPPGHKPAAGGGALGAADGDGARRAARAMADRLEAARPGARIDGFLVQEMTDGLEVVLGVHDDPQFGPVLGLGLGGVLVEAVDDAVFRQLPVDAAEAAGMIGELRCRALCGSVRGRPERDVDAVAAAAAGLGETYAEFHAGLAGIEINPLVVLAGGGGVRAVDLRLDPRRDSRPPRRRLHRTARS